MSQRDLTAALGVSLGKTNFCLKALLDRGLLKMQNFQNSKRKLAYERIEETDNPELAFDRAMETYLKKGYSKEWSGLSTRQFRQRKELKKKSCPLALRKAAKSPSKAAPLPVTPEKPLRPSQANPSSAVVTQSS